MAGERGLGYRPTLDGLRGIAVALVIAQHADVPLLSRAGGVGVTMFFVLSGFLITTLLLEERQRAGRIDFAAFYQRRARRLLPALAVYLAVMAAAGLSLATIAAAALYVANWSFALNGPDPMLVHLWSLSIEEQFYIVWPLALLGLLRLPRRWMVGMLIALIVVSTALRVASTLAGDPYWWPFFATHLRADGLLAGGLLAFVPWTPGRLAVGAGVAAVAFACLLPSREGHTIAGISLAVAGSVVLVAVGRNQSPRSLAWRPLVYLGAISYGLYLWHFPLTEVAPWWVAIPLAVAIAAASHRWIEQPFLRRRSVPQHQADPLRLRPAASD